MRRELAAKPRQIESSVDLPHQMIFGDRIAKMKLVEQLTLVTLQTAHHGSTPPRFVSTQRNHGSRPVSIDFCNKIGQKATSAGEPTTSASLIGHLGSSAFRLSTTTVSMSLA